MRTRTNIIKRGTGAGRKFSWTEYENIHELLETVHPDEVVRIVNEASAWDAQVAARMLEPAVAAVQQ